MLSDVDCFRFSGSNAQILTPKVDIDSTPKLLVLLCLRSRRDDSQKATMALSSSPFSSTGFCKLTAEKATNNSNNNNPGSKNSLGDLNAD